MASFTYFFLGSTGFRSNSYIVITFLDKIYLNLLMILKRHFFNHAKMSFKWTLFKHLVFKQLI